MAFLDKTGLERLWLHILSKTNQTLASAKQYADDIKNDLLNGAGGAYDTLKELGDLIDENADAIDAIERLADTKSDKGHIHDDRYYTEAEVDDALKFVKEASGEVIAVNDSAEQALVGLKLYGKTTQATTTGKNLLRGSIWTNSEPFKIVAWQDDSNVIVDADAYLEANKTYTFSMRTDGILKQENGADTVEFFLLKDRDYDYYIPSFAAIQNGNYVTCVIRPEQSGLYTLRLDANKNGTTHSFWDIMIEEGTTATAFEPYSGGIPSPNPNYPQELVNVGADGNIGVYTRGKNLLKYPYGSTGITETAGISFDDFGDGRVSFSGTATGTDGIAYIFQEFTAGNRAELQPGIYTISGNPTSNMLMPFYFYESQNAEKESFVHNAVGGNSVTFTLDRTMYYGAYIWIPSGTTVDAMVSPQLELGSAATAFESYKNGGSLTISTPNGLPGIPVSSGGNYMDADGKMWLSDVMDYGRGVKVQNVVTERVRPGTLGEQDNYGFFVNLPVNSATDMILCNMATNNGTWDLTGGVTYIPGLKRVIFSKEWFGVSTLAEFNAYLDNNELTIMYALDTPIETPISASELVAYRAMSSQYPNTTVYNDAGAGMAVEYADVKIDELEKALIDPTLSIKGAAAEAQTVGKELQHLQKETQFLDEAKGNIITVNNSAELPLNNLKLYGKTTQTTTMGKNLLDIANIVPPSATYRDITITSLGNGFAVKGTATGGNAAFRWALTTPIPAGTYWLHAQNIGFNAACTLYFEKPGTVDVGHATLDSNYRKQKITSDGDLVYLKLYIPSGQTVDMRLYPMLTIEDTDTYEPYTGGIPSPNPNYPQPLVSPGDSGSIQVKACGKNLIPSFAKLDAWFEGLPDANDNAICDMKIAAGTYTFTVKTDSGITRANVIDVTLADENNQQVVTVNPSTAGGFLSLNRSNAFTVTPEQAARIRRIKIFYNRNADSARVNGERLTEIQIESGTAATAYEPYKDGGSVTVSTPTGLPGIPVSSGGNYVDENGQMWICDEVDFGRGVYVQRVKRVILTGAETWSVSSRSNTFLCNNVIDSVNVGDGTSRQTLAMSNKYASVDWETIAFYDYAVALPWGVGIAIRNKDCDTPEAFKAYLASNNCEVLYVLKNPIETPLSSAELTAYRAMTTQNPTTVIYNDAAADMYVSYGTYKAGEMEEALGIPKADKTLTIEGAPADAKAVGDALAGKQPIGDYALKNEIPSVPVQSVNNKTGAVTLTASDVGADASGSANTALTNAKAYTDSEITEWVGDKTVAAQINATAANYLPITGGVITGEGTVKLIPQRSNVEGGEIALGAPSGSPMLNSIILDNYDGKFRVFGYPSADGTTKTGVGPPLVIDPYAKTVAGSGGDYTFYAAKYVVNSAVSMEYDSTNECLNFVFK